MEEIQEVDITARGRGDRVIDKDTVAEISEHEYNNDMREIENFVYQRLAVVPGEPFMLRLCQIPRLPARFHEENKIYYEPAMVSIGPYYHGKEELRAMEEQKWSTLRDFMARNDQVRFGDYFKAIRALEQPARLYYGEIVNMTSNEFVMMLILDGCFILEYFLKQKYHQIDAFSFLTGWASSFLPTDMLLLENQIPFFIIHKLFDTCVGGCQDCKVNCPLLKLISKNLTKPTINIQMKPPQNSCERFYHLLHFYHACMVAETDLIKMEHNLVSNRSLYMGVETLSRLKFWFRGQSKRTTEDISGDEKKAKGEDGIKLEKKSADGKKVAEEESRFIIIPCMSELGEAGVTFKRKKEPRHMFDISFDNGIMEMPLMEIDCTRKIIFSNVVAFEQSQLYSVSNNFMSYMSLMDALINTEKDVALLQLYDILDNFLPSKEEATAFYNHFKIFDIIDSNNHYFKDLFIKVRKYSNSTWHKYRARLMRDYFNNPWTIISVVAAGFLLILNVVQTYYTVYSSIHN